MFLLVVVFTGIILGPGPLQVEAKSFRSQTLIKNSANLLQRGKRFILPGTKWCGDGSVASSEDDFGILDHTDKCCRQHDRCAVIILANSTKYGLTNPDTHTRLHCACDEKFRTCLRKSNSYYANLVGVGYFNALLQKQCFRLKQCENCDGVYEWATVKYWNQDVPSNLKKVKLLLDKFLL